MLGKKILQNLLDVTEIGKNDNYPKYLILLLEFGKTIMKINVEPKGQFLKVNINLLIKEQGYR